MQFTPEPIIWIYCYLLDQEIIGFNKRHHYIEGTVVIALILSVVALTDYLKARSFFFFVNACQQSLVNIRVVYVVYKCHSLIFCISTKLFHE